MNNKNELIRQLEIDLQRVISMIDNCDKKASILLAAFGFFVTILSSKSFLSTLGLLSALKSFNIKDFKLYVVLLIIVAALLLCISIFYILKSIKSTLKLKGAKDIQKTNNCLIYFGDICKINEQEFKTKRLHTTETDRINELVSQLHINSKICFKKFQNYNKGLCWFKASALLICLSLVLFLLNIFLC